MKVSALPRPVAPVWAQPSVDALAWADSEEETVPGQMSDADRADRLRADLLPGVTTCRDYLAELAVKPTPTVRTLLARTDRLIREVSDPAWSPDGLDNALTEVAELLDRLRVLIAACAMAPELTARIAEVQCIAEARARLLSVRLALIPLAPTPPRRRAALASSLSRSGPPALLDSGLATSELPPCR